MGSNQSWDAAVAQAIAALRHEPGALLPVLHAVQDAIGFIPEAAVPMIAEGLNLSRADVHGVITFYPHFRQTPPGRHTLHVCRAEACQAVQGDATIAHAKKRLGVDFHETDARGEFSLEPVFCLGNCALAPAVMIDETLHGRVTPERLDQLLDGLKEDRA